MWGDMYGFNFVVANENGDILFVDISESGISLNRERNGIRKTIWKK